MISSHVLYPLPYLLGLSLSLGMAGYVRKYRGNDSARYFSYKVIVESLTIAGFLLEMVSPTLSEKILWDDAQYVLDLALPGLGYIFVLSIVRREIRRSTAYLIVLIPASVCAALMATDPLHHLIRPTAYLNTAPLFSELLYPLTTVQYALLGYVLLFFLFNTAILAAAASRTRGVQRRQAIVVAAALVIPLVGGSLTILGVQLGPYRDMSPLFFTLQDLAILVALTRFSLFDIVPAARDLAIEHMDVSLFVEDAQHRIVDVNRAGLRVLGLSLLEVIGRNTRDIFPHHHELLERLRDADEGVYEVAGMRPLTLGRTFELHLTSTHDRLGRKTGRLLLLHEITTHKALAGDLRKTRDELAARLAELERVQEELLRRERLSTLGQTVATVSHEIRNPLATVRNALFSIREALAAGDPGRVERAIKLAERNVRRCNAIIMELLDYSRQRPPALREVDVDSWLARILDELETPEGIEVRRNLESRARARMDPDRLQRAAENILRNALQAMTTGDAQGMILSVEAVSREGWIELAFRDLGPGMSAEVLARAGEPLFSTKPYGVGLGLPIVREVMQEHGGSVQIESAKGKGTVVTLRLPVAEKEGLS